MIPELESFKMPILSLVTLTPALGALLLTLIDSNSKALIRQIALMVSFLGLLFSLIAGDGLALKPSGFIGSLVGALIVTAGWQAYRRKNR